jgi:hypothetical protein
VQHEESGCKEAVYQPFISRLSAVYQPPIILVSKADSSFSQSDTTVADRQHQQARPTDVRGGITQVYFLLIKARLPLGAAAGAGWSRAVPEFRCNCQ